MDKFYDILVKTPVASLLDMTKDEWVAWAKDTFTVELAVEHDGVFIGGVLSNPIQDANGSQKCIHTIFDPQRAKTFHRYCMPWFVNTKETIYTMAHEDMPMIKNLAERVGFVPVSKFKEFHVLKRG